MTIYNFLKNDHEKRDVYITTWIPPTSGLIKSNKSCANKKIIRNKYGQFIEHSEQLQWP